jgi:glutathione synthase/RimK-type ligase-like ATP-grasp enzyme
MNVVLLAKDRHASEPVLRRFLAVGAVRAHDVQWHDKPSFLAADLARVDLVCLKSHVDDREVWHKIEAQGVRAVNRREAGLACGGRSQLDALLRAGGVRTPRSAVTAAEVGQLKLPIVRKPNAASASREVRVFNRAPEPIDCERYFFQEWMAGDGVVCKVYCIAGEAFLVEELDTDPAAPDAPAGRRQAVAMEPGLAEAARTVGRRTGLEIYGLDFVGWPGERVLIDVNPFPSFRCLPQAAEVLWDYLEKIGPGARAGAKGRTA